MKSLVVLACGAFCGSVFAQSDLELYELRGPVKSVTVKGYHAEPKGKSFVKTAPGWYEGEGEDRSYTFDENGNILLINTLDEDGREQIEEQFTYENGMLVHHFAFYEQMNYFYDADGALKETVSRGHGMHVRQVYSNMNGKPVEVFSIDMEGDTTDHELVKYDANGNLLSWISVPVNGQDFYTYETTCTYDAGGNRISERFLTDYANQVTEMTYADGHIASQTISDYKDGVLVGYEERKYDSNGLIIEKTTYEIADPYDISSLRPVRALVFSYSFDRQGNWTQQTMAINIPDNAEGAALHYIVERKITYY